MSIIGELNRQISEIQAALATRFEQHPDAAAYLSQPGLGKVLGARVLGKFGDDPDRYTSAKSRRNYAGTSPITVASSRKRAVLARYVRGNRRAYTTRSTNGRSVPSPTAQAPEPSTTSAEQPATSTTKPYEP